MLETAQILASDYDVEVQSTMQRGHKIPRNGWQQSCYDQDFPLARKSGNFCNEIACSGAFWSTS